MHLTVSLRDVYAAKENHDDAIWIVFVEETRVAALGSDDDRLGLSIHRRSGDHDPEQGEAEQPA